jgi:hypothetical protein
MTLPQWKHVLRVSDMWQMDELRDATLTSMETLFSDETTALKLRIALDTNVEKWKYPALARLILRIDPLTADDIDTLGSTTSSHVLRIREADICKYGGSLQRDIISTTANQLAVDLFGSWASKSNRRTLWGTSM